MTLRKKYVVLDLNHLSGPEVTAVYGPYTERSGRRALSKMIDRLKAHSSTQERRICSDKNGAATVVDGLGTIRELRLIQLSQI